MDRNIAILTLDIELPQMTYLEAGLDRYNRLMSAKSISTGFTIVGSLSDVNGRIGLESNIPMINQDGSVDFDSLGRVTTTVKRTGEKVLADSSDVFVATGRKIVEKDSSQKHIRNRNCEAYGGSPRNVQQMGSSGFFGLNHLRKLTLEEAKNKFIDYVIRHEFGHGIGGFDEFEGEDNVMVPLSYASENNLLRKSVDYTPEQIEQIRKNVAVINVQRIRKIRAKIYNLPPIEVLLEKFFEDISPLPS